MLSIHMYFPSVIKDVPRTILKLGKVDIHGKLYFRSLVSGPHRQYFVYERLGFTILQTRMSWA